MPANTRRVYEDTTRRSPYNKAPTYEELSKILNPPSDTSAISSGASVPTDNETASSGNVPSGSVPLVTASGSGAPLPPVQGRSVGNLGPEAVNPYYVPPVTPATGDTGTGGTQPASQPVPGYDDMLNKYLGTVFGGGRSFDPVAQQITGQRDDALRAMAEKMASRGMGNSGALAMGAGDIYGQAGQDLASAYQDWRGQGIQEMKGALAPFIEEAMSEKLMGFSTEEKLKILEAETDAIMKKMFGENYDPNMGAAEYEFWSGMANKGEPDEEMQRAIEVWLKRNPNFNPLFQDPYDRYKY